MVVPVGVYQNRRIGEHDRGNAVRESRRRGVVELRAPGRGVLRLPSHRVEGGQIRDGDAVRPRRERRGELAERLDRADTGRSRERGIARASVRDGDVLRFERDEDDGVDGEKVRSRFTLVPIRPRRRGERRSLRTFLPGVSLRPPLAFDPRHRRLSTPLLTPFNSNAKRYALTTAGAIDIASAVTVDLDAAGFLAIDSTTTSKLVLAPHALGRDGDTLYSYAFAIDVSDANGAAKASIDLRRNVSPVAGMVAALPAKGVAAQTTFAIAVGDGSLDPDGHLPLMIRFTALVKGAPAYQSRLLQDYRRVPSARANVFHPSIAFLIY